MSQIFKYSISGDRRTGSSWPGSTWSWPSTSTCWRRPRRETPSGKLIPVSWWYWLLCCSVVFNISRLGNQIMQRNTPWKLVKKSEEDKVSPCFWLVNTNQYWSLIGSHNYKLISDWLTGESWQRGWSVCQHLLSPLCADPTLPSQPVSQPPGEYN